MHPNEKLILLLFSRTIQIINYNLCCSIKMILSGTVIISLICLPINSDNIYLKLAILLHYITKDNGLCYSHGGLLNNYDAFFVRPFSSDSSNENYF